MKTLALLLALGCASPAARAGAEESAENSWFSAGREAVARAHSLEPAARPARNLILFIGDGMGLTTVTAARILEGQLRGEPGEENLLAFERLPYVSLVKTYNTNQQTPDSAGTATAMLSGAKTRAGVIGVDETVARGDAAGVAGHELRTLFERAEERGLSTGVVTTTRITHATPAAAYAHAPDRGWEDDSRLPTAARELDFPDIARQLVEFSYGDGLEVALGGGRAQFLPQQATDPEYPDRKGARRDGRDLSAEWSARGPGSQYVWHRAGLLAMVPSQTEHLLGLFEPSHMHYEQEREKDKAGEPSLAEMTERALEILRRSAKGFVLMVEAGRIDHGHHLGNAHRALVDTIALSDAVRVALQHTDPAKTLVVVTADHGHVFTIGGYPVRGNPILGLVKRTDERGEPSDSLTRDAQGLPYTTLGYHNGPGYSGANQAGDGKRPDLSEVDTAAPNYLQESAVPMSSETHSGEDVPVYAGGPGAHLFHGVQEQSYLYHAMVEALGWRETGAESGALRRALGGTSSND